MSVKANVAGGAMIGTDKRLLPVIADKGDKGDASTQPGPIGPNGWTPILAGELDGNRTLMKVIDWTGGGSEKPAIGMYIGTTGYVTTKAAAFNFNAAKRVMTVQGITAAVTGIATIDLTPYGFSNPPVAVALPAATVALSGPTRSTIVAGTVTKTSLQIKVEQQGLVTGVVSALAGAMANAILIET